MNRSQVYIASATIGLSFIQIFSYFLKIMGMSSFEQLFFRLLLGLVILLAVMVVTKHIKIMRKKHLAFFAAIGFTFMFAIPWLLVVWLFLRNFTQMQLFVGVTMPDTTQLVLLVFFAAFSTVVPYGLLNYVKAEEVSPTTEGLLLLGDPLLHTIWATLFLRQFISEIQYVGAALILISAALNLKVRSKKNSG